MISQHQRIQDKTIDAFEKDLDKERKEKNFNEKQEEKQKKEFEAKEKQRLKAEKMENFSKFNGKPAVPRSEKKAFKPLVIKKDNMDEATKDQREYLGLELFGILRQFQDQ